ncbi:hypothetical protein H072_3998 [Dactylellina haptotyla CBS 200.50]|uniref:peptidylprolyl isomerase n=1 Tax=Dactylellina haptotyla (strain CBS 200.50) TaxID=1284197 RepID=S8ALM6_DACHA|nr:hypothetical protein H072_3998 [Dactylellina haptotyla CBS 200.50]
MGVKKVITKPGKGGTPRKGDTVVMHYTGRLENGNKFDSSRDRNQPFETPIGVGRVIRGWDDGILGLGDDPAMQIGEHATLTITSDYGYGERGAGGVIPGGATLIFDVELIDIKRLGGEDPPKKEEL